MKRVLDEEGVVKVGGEEGRCEGCEEVSVCEAQVPYPCKALFLWLR